MLLCWALALLALDCTLQQYAALAFYLGLPCPHSWRSQPAAVSLSPDPCPVSDTEITKDVCFTLLK